MAYLMEFDYTGTSSNLDVYYVFVSPNTDKTSAQVRAYIAIPAAVVSVGYDLVLASSSFTGSYTPGTITSTGSDSVTFNLSGLTPGASYKIKVRAFSSAGATGSYGFSTYTEFTMPILSNAGSISNTTNRKEWENTTDYSTGGLENASEEQKQETQAIVSSGNIERTTKSLFKLSQNEVNPDIYSVAYKTYSSLLTNQTYYAFGTSLFFTANTTNPNQSGGFAFFVDNDGTSGYIIQISTSASAATNNQKEFKILKIKNGRMTQLQDSQTVSTKSLGGIFGGRTYKIDVRVKVNSTSVEIYAYVNGFKITALDANPVGSYSTVDPTEKLSATNKVAMICNFGTVYFDYIYGMHLTQEKYEQENIFNIYDGQYSDAVISFLYGNKTLENNSISGSLTNGFIEEFGCVARELRLVKTKYNSRPAFPSYASTGINAFAKIIGQRLTSFGAEVYVINNSGTYIPLDDSQFYSFYILGKYISQSGVIEYIDGTASEYSVQQPVIFESKWIQKQSDVENLANWIKEIWSSKQRIINMEVFGNPLLSIGDVITVAYTYHNLTSSDKFVVTNINHEFREGLTTTITARTL